MKVASWQQQEKKTPGLLLPFFPSSSRAFIRFVELRHATAHATLQVIQRDSLIAHLQESLNKKDKVIAQLKDEGARSVGPISFCRNNANSALPMAKGEALVIGRLDTQPHMFSQQNEACGKQGKPKFQ